jgi:hypothetical protein
VTGNVAELVDFLLPAERKELDAHLVALADVPRPDVAYQKDPIGWMGDKLGIPESHVRWSLNPEYATHAWDGTVDPLATLCESLANGQDAAAESATGTGKTYLAAALALWFLACFEDALVVTTAPKEGQLTTQLWKEIGRHWPRFAKAYPVASKVTLRIRMKEGTAEQETWAILGYACSVGTTEDSATKAQGFHAAHMLIITEETPGIDPAVMTAFKNTCTGDHNIRLALGNPDHPRDALHQMCAQKSVKAVRISALDHPNVVCRREIIPGAAGRKSIDAKLEEYKSETHPMYQSRVRGLCPTEGTLPFPKTMVERCHSPLSTNPACVWGWDLARAQDETVGMPIDAYGFVTKDFQRWAKKPWPEQVRDIVALCGKVPGCMDSTGVGDAVYEFAQTLGSQLSPFVFGERSRQELLERLQGALLNLTVRGPFAEGGELAWITTQLESFQFVYTSSGVKWRCPDDQHDDGVMALALAVYAYDRVSPRVPAMDIPQHGERRDPTRWEELVAVGPDGSELPGDGFDSQLPRGW